MTEIWLRQNNRAILFGMLMPALFLPLLVVWLFGWFAPRPAGAWQVVGWSLVGMDVLLLLALGGQLRQPRLAYRDGHLLVNLHSGPPIAVPIAFVEAFLLGTGPAMLPGRRDDRTEARTLSVRLAERADAWANVSVKPALGKWCGGYISIRGTWCEPLSVDLVNRLNKRLSEVQQEQAARQVTS